MSDPSLSVAPITAAEIGGVGELARSIWRQHYVTIISGAQIEYMLRDKYTEADLARYAGRSPMLCDSPIPLTQPTGSRP